MLPFLQTAWLSKSSSKHYLHKIFCDQGHPIVNFLMTWEGKPQISAPEPVCLLEVAIPARCLSSCSSQRSEEGKVSHLNCSNVAEIISVSCPLLSDFSISGPRLPVKGFGEEWFHLTSDPCVSQHCVWKALGVRVWLILLRMKPLHDEHKGVY